MIVGISSSKHMIYWAACTWNAGNYRSLVKSTPSSQSESSCSVSSIDAVSGVGYWLLHGSSRLYQMAGPLRSQYIALTRSERLPQNSNRWPSRGLLSSTSETCAHRPSKLHLISTGAMAMKIRVSARSFSMADARARPAAMASPGWIAARIPAISGQV